MTARSEGRQQRPPGPSSISAAFRRAVGKFARGRVRTLRDDLDDVRRDAVVGGMAWGAEHRGNEQRLRESVENRDMFGAYEADAEEERPDSARRVISRR